MQVKNSGEYSPRDRRENSKVELMQKRFCFGFKFEIVMAKSG